MLIPSNRLKCTALVADGPQLLPLNIYALIYRGKSNPMLLCSGWAAARHVEFFIECVDRLRLVRPSRPLLELCEQ